MVDREQDKESKCFIHFSMISKNDKILIMATGTSLRLSSVIGLFWLAKLEKQGNKVFNT